MALTEKYVSDAGAGAHDGSSEAAAFSWAEMITDINAGSKAGNRYNVIKGAGAIARTTTTDTISGSGSATSPVVIRGYTTAITDGYQGRTSGNGALITTNMAVITYTSGSLVLSGSWIIMESFSVTSAKSGATIAAPPFGAITRCVVSNSSTNGAATAVTCSGTSGGATIVYDNDLSLTGASGGSAAVVGGSQSRIVANRIKGGPGIGVTLNTNSNANVVVDNVIYACAGLGIAHTSTTNSPHFIYGNTVVGGTTDGIDIGTGTTILVMICNNLITDNGGNGIDGVSASNAIFAAHNRTRDNSAATNSATDWLAATKYGHVTTDTGGAETDYTNSGSNDYTLINTSPAKGVGLFAYRSIGALQPSGAVLVVEG